MAAAATAAPPSPAPNPSFFSPATPPRPSPPPPPLPTIWADSGPSPVSSAGTQQRRRRSSLLGPAPRVESQADLDSLLASFGRKLEEAATAAASGVGAVDATSSPAATNVGAGSPALQMLLGTGFSPMAWPAQALSSPADAAAAGHGAFPSLGGSGPAGLTWSPIGEATSGSTAATTIGVPSRQPPASGSPLRPFRVSPGLAPPLAKGGAKRGERDLPAPMSLEEADEGLHRAGIAPGLMSLWRDQLRQWFAEHLLARLVGKMDSSPAEVVATAAKLGLPVRLEMLGADRGSGGNSEADGASGGLAQCSVHGTPVDEHLLLQHLRMALEAERDKPPPAPTPSLFGLQSSAPPAPGLVNPLITECLDAVKDHQQLRELLSGAWRRGFLPHAAPDATAYIVRRIRELAEGWCVRGFEWAPRSASSGGSGSGQLGWSMDLPSDPHLLIYLFCALLEHPNWMLHLDSAAHTGVQAGGTSLYIGALPAVDRLPEHFVAILSGPPVTGALAGSGACILSFSKAVPPVFALFWDKKPQFCFQGRTALWDAVALLCHRVREAHSGALRGLSLASPSLDLMRTASCLPQLTDNNKNEKLAAALGSLAVVVPGLRNQIVSIIIDAALAGAAVAVRAHSREKFCLETGFMTTLGPASRGMLSSRLDASRAHSSFSVRGTVPVQQRQGVGHSDEEKDLHADSAPAVVKYLLQKQYLLTALELLHELLEDGRAEDAKGLQDFFDDEDMFPPHQMVQLRRLSGLDDVEEAVEVAAAAHRATQAEQKLHLALDEVARLQDELNHLRRESSTLAGSPAGAAHSQQDNLKFRRMTLHTIGKQDNAVQLEEDVRHDLDCAVKEYLVSADYKMTAMTFCDEVGNQDLDNWQGSHCRPPDALQAYYKQYYNSTSQTVQVMQQELQLLRQERETFEKDTANLRAILEYNDDVSKQKEEEMSEEARVLRHELDDRAAELDKLKKNLVFREADDRGPPVVVPAESLEGLNFEEGMPKDIAAPSTTALAVPDYSLQLSTVTHGDNVVQAPGVTDAFVAGTNGHGHFKHLDKETKSEDESVIIIAESLPKIVPNVLINKREVLLPLFMCAITRHPDAEARDSLAHSLFNLIKKPSLEQRGIIIACCKELAEHIGKERTESELLPHCWGQAETCSSLMLSMLAELTGDAELNVREVAALSLATLLPLITDMDKYPKVEDLVLGVVCDPAGEVVKIGLQELVPALVSWGKQGKRPLSQFLRSLLSRLLGPVQRCSPASGVEGSVESHIRVLGDRERWDVDVLLQLLKSLLPEVLLGVSDQFGQSYLVNIMLPVFRAAVGADYDVSFLPATMQQQLSDLKPSSPMEERLANATVLPLLLAGVMGSPQMTEGALASCLKDLVLQSCQRLGAWSERDNQEYVDAVRFLCLYEQHHHVVLGVLWELVVMANSAIKVTAAVLLKAMTPYAGQAKVSQQILPALVTLGSDPNIEVKYSTIAAFGVVVQHYKDDMTVDKVRVQLETFLEDGSHEASLAVIRTLTAAVAFLFGSLTISALLVQKVLQMASSSSVDQDLARRRARVEILSEAMKAVDKTDVSAAFSRDLLVPAVQALLRDNALEGADKECLDGILRNRGGGPAARHKSGLFGDGGLLGKKDAQADGMGGGEGGPWDGGALSPGSQPQQEEGRLKRMMRLKYEEMVKGRSRPATLPQPLPR
eukprot:SM000044S16007  [mRNA]  locus=s44:565678:576581:+ [translate_table: standard]